ncbi:hypothetical protein [Ruegeria sp. A3M17]|uniref:hypothetical protein n=1 Tax=Ruegeria sp. A3M17 TaxID=2267229 RepID=UPI000DEBFF99|nr:hypothetical protein [Ruegeria sp. A3M17]RBW58729.1 hypothetical protein DS906_07970 [Ruegeria sp. A3M17]
MFFWLKLKADVAFFVNASVLAEFRTERHYSQFYQQTLCFSGFSREFAGRHKTVLRHNDVPN